MFQALQRLIHRGDDPSKELSWLEDWARARGDRFKRVRGAEGFVIEGEHEGGGLRIEWGPPQRDYLRGTELRLRWELGLPQGMELLVITRALAESLEAAAYDRLTLDQQTAVDSGLSEEARWLAMYDRLQADALPPAVHDAYVVVGASTTWAQAWLEGELATRLARAPEHWLADAPLVLMTLRGRLYLRTEADAIEPDLLDGVRGLAEAAAHRAQAVASIDKRSS